jgi:hypothetical protein
MPRRPVVLTAWCPGCQSNVRPRDWDQDTYLCASCTTDLHRMVRAWGSGRVLSRYPISALLGGGRARVRR